MRNAFLIALFFPIFCFSQVDTDSIKELLNGQKKNEFHLLLTLNLDLRQGYPQYGLGYSRSISRNNKLWITANHLRGDLVTSRFTRKNRLYELGISYEFKIFKTHKLFFTPMISLMNTNWYWEKFRSGKISTIDNSRYYIVNFTPMLKYSKGLVSLSFGYDAGYGKGNTHIKGYYSDGRLYREIKGEGYGGVLSKEWHILINYKF